MGNPLSDDTTGNAASFAASTPSEKAKAGRA
jgi:hypothetical protein